METPLILYSTNSSIAYKINEEFYNSCHYVWCSPYFDCNKMDFSLRNNPVSSNPYNIYRDFLNSAKDENSRIIQDNRKGLAHGVKAKFDSGIIDEKQKEKLLFMIKNAGVEEFSPILYVIPYDKVKDILVEAPLRKKANIFSKEYIIPMLTRKAFDIIIFEELK
jgi:hypothetical protein